MFSFIWEDLQSFAPHIEEIRKAEGEYRKTHARDKNTNALYQAANDAQTYIHNSLCKGQVEGFLHGSDTCPIRANAASRQVTLQSDEPIRFKRDQVVVHYLMKLIKKSLRLLSRK